MSGDFHCKVHGLDELLSDLGEIEDLLGKVVVEVVETAGDAVVDKAKAGIDTGRGEWEPLAEATIAMKGHGKALIDSRLLRDSIAGWWEGATRPNAQETGVYSVGIPFGVTYPDGTPLEMVAVLMEEGATISIDTESRKVLEGKRIDVSKGAKVIRIPPRPFLEPAMNEVADTFEEVVAESMNRLYDRLLKG